MSIFTWLNDFRSARTKASSLYKRGMAKAIKRDQRGAMKDYTTAISMVDAPPDIVAMTRYNRALLHVSQGNDQQAVDDLQAVLAMDELLINVKTMSRQKLAQIDARAQKGNQRGRG